ncbi:MAG: ACP phosphodiesterase [Porticoccaceae bacterium]|nr:ACP phosphodiesterase [Porticoccaceae bacterium]
MNYLAHIALAGDNPEHQVGGLLGDFVRGPLRGQYSPAIQAGIYAHRKLDHYVDQQPEIRLFLQRFESPMRRYAGIVADVFYDHLLACDWHQYYQQPLDGFCQDFYRHLGNFGHDLPPRAQMFLERAPSIGWLEGYAEADHLPMILQRTGQRLRRPVALEEALPIIEQHKSAIAEEFHQLYPRLQTFVRTTLQEIDLN